MLATICLQVLILTCMLGDAAPGESMPKKIEVTWNAWSAYGDCSTTCGPGKKTRTRTCSNTGACVGDPIASETTGCNVKDCTECEKIEHCEVMQEDEEGGCECETCETSYKLDDYKCQLSEECEKIEHCDVMQEEGCGCKTCKGPDIKRDPETACPMIEHCLVHDEATCVCKTCNALYALDDNNKKCKLSECTDRAPNTLIKDSPPMRGRTQLFHEDETRYLKCATGMWDKNKIPRYSRNTQGLLMNEWAPARCRSGSWKMGSSSQLLDCVTLDPKACLNGGKGWTENGKTTCICPKYRTGEKCEKMGYAFCFWGCAKPRECKISLDGKSASCV